LPCAAPASILYSAAIINLGSNLAETVKTLVEPPRECQVILTVLQHPSTDENAFWPLLYDYYAATYDVVFANAAGNKTNEYPYYVPVTIPGAAYNGITTGGLIPTNSTAIYDKVGDSSLSGDGNGRRKPDICAPSSYQIAPAYSGQTDWTQVPSDTVGYTSYAVPHTAGVAALLLDYADGSGDMDRAHSEVIKAVMVNSTFPNIQARDGSSTVETLESEPNWPWHTDRGYGRLDALRAFKTLASNRITPGSSTADPNGWAYASIGPGQSHSYLIAGVENQRLVMTLTWHRKVAWTDISHGLEAPNGIIDSDELEGMDLTDLNLEVIDPDLTPLITSFSTIDNLEKLDLRFTKTGNYEVQIVNQEGDETAYGLAFEILEPLSGDVYVDYVVDLKDVSGLAEHWLSVGCNDAMQACYEYDLSGNARIDLDDFSILAAHWLATDERYYAP